MSAKCDKRSELKCFEFSFEVSENFRNKRPLFIPSDQCIEKSSSHAPPLTVVRAPISESWIGLLMLIEKIRSEELFSEQEKKNILNLNILDTAEKLEDRINLLTTESMFTEDNDCCKLHNDLLNCFVEVQCGYEKLRREKRKRLLQAYKYLEECGIFTIRAISFCIVVGLLVSVCADWYGNTEHLGLRF